MVFLPGISWTLFALGGTQISDKVPGWKGWRRFILPIVYFITCLIAGITLWQNLLITGISVGSYSLGYGEKKSWPQKAIVGLMYALVSIPIGISAWNLFTMGGFLGLFALSNTKLTANMFTWKICEGFFGLLVGIQLAYILMHYRGEWLWMF